MLKALPVAVYAVLAVGGMAKTHLQNMAIGSAVNIDRLFNWFQEVPLAKTRVSRFKALEPAA